MQFLAILIVAALWAKWVLVLIAIVTGAYALQRVVRQIRASNVDAEAAVEAEAAAEAETVRLDSVLARADQQHQWVMQGDPRGTFGDESAFTPM
jgi:Tfp pilus assembly protein PilV